MGSEMCIRDRTRKNFKSNQRAFEIELKKVIKKFNESEIQYKYFMKKMHIEEQMKRSKMVELKKKQRQENLRVQSLEQDPDLPNMERPRVTQITSEICDLVNSPEFEDPQKNKVDSEVVKESEDVVTFETGNQSNDEKELPVEAKPKSCLLYTSPSPRDLSTSRMPSSA